MSQLNQKAARAISANWFDLLGLRMVKGRTFTAGELGVAVVNATWATESGGPDKIIGASITYRVDGVGPLQPAIVVGVVENAYERLAWGRDVPVAYVPEVGDAPADLTLYLRGPGAATAGPVLRSILASTEPTLAPTTLGTVTDLMDDFRSGELRMAQILAFMSAVAIALAAVGLLGATGEAAGARKREFGIRLALGARPGTIAWAVMARTLAIVCAGGGVGMGVALLIMRAIAQQPQRISVLDPVLLVVTLGAMVVMALAGSLGPVRRAMRIDPVASLRAE
jgi:putative ABC transport system permease protein